MKKLLLLLALVAAFCACKKSGNSKKHVNTREITYVFTPHLADNYTVSYTAGDGSTAVESVSGLAGFTKIVTIQNADVVKSVAFKVSDPSISQGTRPIEMNITSGAIGNHCSCTLTAAKLSSEITLSY